MPFFPWYPLPLVPGVPEVEISISIAFLERIATSKYRGWAKSNGDPAEQAGLLACEQRELGGADFRQQFVAANGRAVAARFLSLSACEEANSGFFTALIAAWRRATR